MYRLTMIWHHTLLDITNEQVIACFPDPAFADGIARRYLKKLDCAGPIEAVAEAKNAGAVSWWYTRTCEGEAMVRLDRLEEPFGQ